MAILTQAARLLLAAHKIEPISGTVLLIGRQSVFLNENSALAFLRSEGIEPISDYKLEIDQSTVQSHNMGYITDRCLFSMFTDANVIALDVSDYEDAEIVHDLNSPLPDRYAGVADFIFNGSCLDNLFDPATAMKSFSKMLRAGGRMFSIEHGTQAHGAYIMYSPEWFFGFYAANSYEGCRIYMGHFDEDIWDDFDLYLWRPFVEEKGKIKPSPNRVEDGEYVIFALAKKGAESTDEKTPIQGFYRMMQNDEEVNTHYFDRAAYFDKSMPKFSVAETPPLHIKPKRKSKFERLYERWTGQRVYKWLGSTGRPQYRIGDRRHDVGPNYEFIGTLRVQP